MGKEEKKVETEEEMKERLKKEIMAELLEEIEEGQIEVPEKKKKQKKEELHKETKKVHFDHYDDSGIKMVNEMNQKERSISKKEKKQPERISLPKSKDTGNSKVTTAIVFLSLIVLIVTVFFLNDEIYRFFFNKKEPSSYKTSNSSNSNEEKLEEITLESELLTTFTYPIMRNNPYEKDSYYTMDSFTMSDLSNNDILYNALIHVRTGNFLTYEDSYQGNYCVDGDHKKAVSEKYIDARINNLYGKSTEYEHGNFTVPSTNQDTEYVGDWKYDAKNHQYIYYGDCKGFSPKNIIYYDLKNAYQVTAKNNNETIDLLYYVAFAQVDRNTKKYTIFSDLEMTNILTDGTLTTDDYEAELKDSYRVINTPFPQRIVLTKIIAL